MSQAWEASGRYDETMTTTPLVDIIMPTYNHERFIAQAIESVLAQQTNFEYRLNIADDCSTDNTQTIIKDYAQKHPDQIRTVLSPHNIGIVHKDRLSIKVLKLCTAKYVALLEGTITGPILISCKNKWIFLKATRTSQSVVTTSRCFMKMEAKNPRTYFLLIKTKSRPSKICFSLISYRPARWSFGAAFSASCLTGSLLSDLEIGRFIS